VSWTFLLYMICHEKLSSQFKTLHPWKVPRPTPIFMQVSIQKKAKSQWYSFFCINLSSKHMCFLALLECDLTFQSHTGACQCTAWSVVLTSYEEWLLLILCFLYNIHVILWHIELKNLLQLRVYWKSEAIRQADMRRSEVQSHIWSFHQKWITSKCQLLA